MSPATLAVIVHTIVTLALLGAYLAVSLSGIDGTPLLTLLVGVLAGATTQAGIDKTGGTKEGP